MYHCLAPLCDKYIRDNRKKKSAVVSSDRSERILDNTIIENNLIHNCKSRKRPMNYI